MLPETAPTAKPTEPARCRRRAPPKRRARGAQARSQAAPQPTGTIPPSITSSAAGTGSTGLYQAAGSTEPSVCLNYTAAAGEVLSGSSAGCVRDGCCQLLSF